MKCVIVGFLALAVITPDGDRPPERERFDNLVREDLFEGFRGDTESLERGLKNCEVALAKDPKHAEALVWRGAARVYKAGQAFQAKKSGEGIKLYNTGMKDMDQAVKLEPKNVGVRIPRASVLSAASRGMPAGMAKPLLETVRGDFETIYAGQKERGDLDKLGKHPRGELRMGLADIYRRLDQPEKSTEQLDAILKELPGSKYAQRATEWKAADPKTTLVHNCIGCHTK